jgi:F-type H+-transporting ATPase subunit a
MFVVELISNLARILSLSLRLFGNIFGDEQAASVISGLVPWIIPVFLMPLALLVAVIQTFIFIVLSMIYLGEVTHHEAGEHAGPGAAAEAH